jgi:hypothetical protein
MTGSGEVKSEGTRERTNEGAETRKAAGPVGAAAFGAFGRLVSRQGDFEIPRARAATTRIGTYIATLLGPREGQPSAADIAIRMWVQAWDMDTLVARVAI